MLNIIKIWEGILPEYWDVNEWFQFNDDQLILVFKQNGKRVLETRDIKNGQIVHSMRSKWNSIIGSVGSLLFICKLDDARTHLQISKLACYNTSDRTLVWSINSNILVEKYKVPSIRRTDFPYYQLRKTKINLNNGNILDSINTETKWIVSEKKFLFQDKNILKCVDISLCVLWSKEDFFGNWFQASKGDNLYFFLPNNTFIIVDLQSGEILQEFFLNNIKKTRGSIGGNFDFINEISFNRSSIHDIVVNDDFFCWLDNENELIIFDIKNKTGKFNYCFPKSKEIFLTNINQNSTLLYELNNDDQSGKLIVVPWGY